MHTLPEDQSIVEHPSSPCVSAITDPEDEDRSKQHGRHLSRSFTESVVAWASAEGALGEHVDPDMWMEGWGGGGWGGGGREGKGEAGWMDG